MPKPKKYLFSKYPLKKKLRAADTCNFCGEKLYVKILWRKGDFGEVEVSCPKCKESYHDMIGWELMDEPFTLQGKTFYPLKNRANVGPCVSCGKLIAGAPIMLFIREGEGGELDFCLDCFNELKIFPKRLK